MKQTECDHLHLCHNLEFRNKVFLYHIDNKYHSIEGLEEALKSRKSGNRVEVWALIKECLEKQESYKALSSNGQTKCRREMSRLLYRECQSWIKTQKKTPPVNDNFSGLDFIFDQSEKKNIREIEIIEKLVSLKAKTIKSPDGWEVTF